LKDKNAEEVNAIQEKRRKKEKELDAIIGSKIISQMHM
jgi:hypothetical protein